MDATLPFFVALYGQPPRTSMESARFSLFTKKKKNPKVMALPPTSANLLQHILRAHLQVMLWKAANCQGPPDESTNITLYGWEVRDDIPVPVIAAGDPAPPELLDVIRCQCKAQDKKCSSEACGCHKQLLSCTTCCNCSGGEDCFNPHTTSMEVVQEEEQETEDINDDHPDYSNDEHDSDSDGLDNEWVY